MEAYLELPEHSQALANRLVYRMDGELTGNLRVQLLQDLKKAGNGTKILLTTFGVGGVGLNLQMFNVVIFIDRQWNPQVLPPPPFTTQKKISIL